MADRPPGQSRSAVSSCARVARLAVIVVLMAGADAKKSTKKKDRGVDLRGEHGCKFNLEPHKPKNFGRAFFVCDRTAPRLQAVSTRRGSEWTEAMPTKGTGCHEYGYYEGAAPEGCTVGKRCAACANPEAQHLKSEHFENFATGGCSGKCAPKSSTPATTAATAAADGHEDEKDNEDDEEERRIWGSAASKPKSYTLSMEDGWAWKADGDLLRHHRSETTGIEYTSKVEL